jgi:hypothetical protein
VVRSFAQTAVDTWGLDHNTLRLRLGPERAGRTLIVCGGGVRSSVYKIKDH